MTEAPYYFYTLFVYVHKCVGGVHTMLCTWGQSTPCGNQLFPSTMWLLGSEQVLRFGNPFSPEPPPTGPEVSVYMIT